MSLSAIYTSVSGLNTTSFGMSVIGNNVANTNTVGFKGSRTLFSDVLGASLGEDASRQVGRGVRPNEVRTIFTQGAFQPTNNPLDFAIDGNGFFMVRKSDAVAGAAGSLFYTRAGQFGFDKSLHLVNPDGLRLQAYQADIAGNITQTLGDIQMQPLNAEGLPASFRLDERGILYGKYSNGQDRAAAQLALAKFAAPTELTKRGDNLFAESLLSGQRTMAAAGTRGAGNVFANSLEVSNIDLADEFITMITMQRVFQANGMVISTAQEMLDKMINI